MPQKKNPWGAEIVRAYAGDLIGNVVKALSILKGLPIGFNMDIWTIMENVVWDSVDLVEYMITIMTGIIQSLKVNSETMQRLAPQGFSTVTELADMLVRKTGISFRTAHRIVGHAVRNAIDKGLKVSNIDRTMLNESSLKITGRAAGCSDEDIRNALSVGTNIRMRKTVGGPAPEEVQRMIRERVHRLNVNKALLIEEKRKVDTASRSLQDAVRDIVHEP